MGILVRCRCGRTLEAPAELEGRRARCPACGAEVLVGLGAPPGAQGETGTTGGRFRCARCGEQVPRGLLTCPRCGGNPATGAAPRARVGMEPRQEPQEMGFLRLCLGMLFHPVRTSDELVYWLSRPDMLVKAVGLFLSGILLWALPDLLSGGVESPVLGLLAVVVVMSLGLAVTSFFVALVGRVVSGQWLYLATLVGFCFLEGLVRWVTSLLTLAGTLGLFGAGGAVTVGLVVFLWAWLLKLLVIRGIFGYGIGAAFLINFFAGVLRIMVGLAFLGSALP